MLTYLGSLGIRNLGLLDPILRLRVIRVVNFLGRINGRFKVLEEASSLLTLAVNENVVSVVRAA
jgi:hypothetical protein